MDSHFGKVDLYSSFFCSWFATIRSYHPLIGLFVHRYVLKNRSSDEVYFVVTFDLLPVNENGELLLNSDTAAQSGLSDSGSNDKKSNHHESYSKTAADATTSAAAIESSSSSSKPLVDDEDVD